MREHRQALVQPQPAAKRCKPVDSRSGDQRGCTCGKTHEGASQSTYKGGAFYEGLSLSASTCGYQDLLSLSSAGPCEGPISFACC